MKQLLVLVGVQGAGKTSALRRFERGTVLKPSTTRQPRSATDDEYHFENQWNDAEFAWKISRGTVHYGMRWSELQRIDHLGLTVFDPGSLQLLYASKAARDFEIVTIGLDTISSLAEQQARVANDPSRSMWQADFDAHRDTVAKCDVVLHGGEDVIVAAINELAAILGGRGGVLTKESIARLIAAGSLLDGADSGRIEPASYDLRISDRYWCQGKYHDLTDADPVAKIPPYSFAVVQAKEVARLPRFIVATFDVRVSLFMSGVILSNGPQVDPGYSGGLFCMLHNASGTEVGINRGEHFATIQFQSTAATDIGYTAHYQNKKGFTDFLDGSSSRKPGGQIFEHVNSIGERLGEDFKELRTTNLAVLGSMIAILAFGAPIAYWVVDRAISAAEKATAGAEKATTTAEASALDATKKLEDAQRKVNEALAKLNDAVATSSRPAPKGPK